MNFTWQALEDSENARNKIEKHFFEYPEGGHINEDYFDKFLKAICDDFDTPQALVTVWDIIKDESLKPEDKKASIQEIDKVLGIINHNKKTLSKEKLELSQKLIQEREQARKDKDWQKSDELRKQIEDLGFIVEDNKQGTQYLIK
jgi:cysteinyl-tRNA synthetase